MNDEQLDSADGAPVQETGPQDKICHTCEREFYTVEQYQIHISHHRTCGIDGCTFTAHEKVVENHINMQHISGLYDRMRNITTPEDIAKWIADRKRNFPSKENIEKRYKRQEEMFKRGERLPHTKPRFDKQNKTRYTLNSDKMKQMKAKTTKRIQKRPVHHSNAKSVSLINEKSDWNGTMFPFRGTSQLYNCEKSESSEFEDDEWQQESSSSVSNKIVLSNALGSLMSAYNSSDDSENEFELTQAPIQPPKVTENLAQCPDIVISDDEPPEEQTIKHQAVVVPSLNNGTDESPEGKTIKCQAVSVPPINNGTDLPNVKGRTRKRKHCRGGKDKKFNRPSGSDNKDKGFDNRIYKKRKVTLLERLLANEIRHERNVLLQCIRYIISNNFFEKPACDNSCQDVEQIPCNSTM